MKKQKFVAIVAAVAVMLSLFAVTGAVTAIAEVETAVYTQDFSDPDAVKADFDTTDRFGDNNQIDFQVSDGTLNTVTNPNTTFGDVVAWTLKKEYYNFKMELDVQWRGDDGASISNVDPGNNILGIYVRNPTGGNTWRNRFDMNVDPGCGGGFLYQLNTGEAVPRQMMAVQNDTNFEMQEKLDASKHFDNGVLHLTIIVRDTVAAAYANGHLVLTSCNLRDKAGYITFEVSEGQIIIDNLKVTPGDFDLGYAAPETPGSTNALNDKAAIEEDFSFQYVESSGNNTINDVNFDDYWKIQNGILTRYNGVEVMEGHGTDHTAVMTSQYKVKYFDASVEVLYGGTEDRNNVNLWPVLAYGNTRKGSYFLHEQGNGFFVQADGVVTSWSGDSNMPWGGLRTMGQIPNWKPNEWYTLRVRVDGYGYQYYVNGKLVMARTYERGYDSGHEGYVSLQSVNNTTSFRNFSITSLNADGEVIDLPHGTITEVAIDGEEALTMQVGDFQKLSATVSGTENFDDSVIWSVDSANATISAQGGLCAVKEGTVVVTATSAQDPTKTDTLTLTISGKASMTYTEDFDDNQADGWERHDSSVAGSAERTHWELVDGKLHGTSQGFDYKSRYMLGDRVFGNFVLEADVKYNEIVDVQNDSGGFGLIYVRSQNMDKGYEDASYEGGIAFGLQWRSEGESGNRCYFLVTAGNGGFERQISFVGIDDWVKENDVNRIKAIVDNDTIMFYINGNHLEQADVELTEQVSKSGFIGFSVSKTDVEFDNLVVTDLVEPTGLTIEEEKVEMAPGDDRQFIAVLEPVNSTNTSLIWESSDEDVAFVNDTGFVVAVGEGECVIKVSSKTNPELNDSVAITVKAKAPVVDDDKEDEGDPSDKDDETNKDDQNQSGNDQNQSGNEQKPSDDQTAIPDTGENLPLVAVMVLVLASAALVLTHKKLSIG